MDEAQADREPGENYSRRAGERPALLKTETTPVAEYVDANIGVSLLKASSSEIDGGTHTSKCAGPNPAGGFEIIDS